MKNLMHLCLIAPNGTVLQNLELTPTQDSKLMSQNGNSKTVKAWQQDFETTNKKFHNGAARIMWVPKNEFRSTSPISG